MPQRAMREISILSIILLTAALIAAPALQGRAAEVRLGDALSFGPAIIRMDPGGSEPLRLVNDGVDVLVVGAPPLRGLSAAAVGIVVISIMAAAITVLLLPLRK